MAQIAVPRPAARRGEVVETLLGPVLGGVSLILISLSLFMALLWAPTDSFQGMTQRLVYVHAPLSWLAYLSIGVTALGSLIYLIRGSRSWDRLALASAELGVVFTTLSLVTGSLWGRQIWGAWWAWDARITSTLVLWLIYVGYLMLRSATGEGPRTARYAAILGLFGAIDLPIIHMSVTWWRTLHPMPVVIRPADGPQLPGTMLTTLLVSLLAFTLMYVWLLYNRYGLETVQEKVRTLRRRAAEAD